MLKSFYSIQSTLEPLQRVPQINFRSCEFLQAVTCSTGEAEREQRAARSVLLLHAREKEEVRKQTKETEVEGADSGSEGVKMAGKREAECE